ncbi:MAG: hypothetical protein H6726_29925 [Sandaracinaceae bacterium]|nr:hypothetical protein [Sandaracinaceae bacterium]
MPAWFGFVLLAVVVSGCGQGTDSARVRDEPPPASAPSGPTEAAHEPSAETPRASLAPTAPALPVPRDVAVDLVAREKTACAVFQGGAVRCWGFGGQGEQGRGPTQCLTGTAEVSGIADAQQLVGGTDYACAKHRDGRASCWGSQRIYGFDSIAFDQAEAGSIVPYRVLAVSDATSITLGNFPVTRDTLCWLQPSGALRCNHGDSETRLENYETSMPDAVALLTLGTMPCARSATNRLTCLARGNDGREQRPTFEHVVHAAGRGSTGCLVYEDGGVACGDALRELVFNRVPDARDMVSVAVGTEFACGLTHNARVACWGAHALGNGTIDPSPTPVIVEGLRDVAQVVAGGLYACARTRTGEVWCWGAMGDGSLPYTGRTDPEALARAPVDVPNLVDVAAVASSDTYSCAATSRGEVRCWGAVPVGSRRVITPTPTVIEGVADVRMMALLPRLACFLTDTGVACIGADATTGPSSERTPGGRLHVAQARAGVRADRLVTAFGAICARTGTASWDCWGHSERAPVPAASVSAALEGLVSVEHIERHVVRGVNEARGEVVISARAGQDGGQALVRGMGVPVAFDADGGVEDELPSNTPSYGAEFACTIQESGLVACWGSNARGQLGRNMRRDARPTAIPITSLGRARAVAAGAHHVCALRDAGTVACWGDDTYGQLGQGTVRRTERPARVDFDAPCVEAPLDPLPR